MEMTVGKVSPGNDRVGRWEVGGENYRVSFVIGPSSDVIGPLTSLLNLTYLGITKIGGKIYKRSCIYFSKK
jgi:hypothetical protein